MAAYRPGRSGGGDDDADALLGERAQLLVAGAVIVDTACGDPVDEAALARPLEAGRPVGGDGASAALTALGPPRAVSAFRFHLAFVMSLRPLVPW